MLLLAVNGRAVTVPEPSRAAMRHIASYKGDNNTWYENRQKQFFPVGRTVICLTPDAVCGVVL
jgi:hypothetical protein